MIQEITHCTNIRCNVFNLTKIMSNGWILGGDQNPIWLVKGGKWSGVP